MKPSNYYKVLKALILLVMTIVMYNNIEHLAEMYELIHQDSTIDVAQKKYIVMIVVEVVMIVGTILKVPLIEWVFAIVIFVFTFEFFNIFELYEQISTSEQTNECQDVVLDLRKKLTLSLLTCTLFSVLNILLSYLFRKASQKQDKLSESEITSSPLDDLLLQLQELSDPKQEISDTEQAVTAFKSLQSENERLQSVIDRFLYCSTCDRYFTSQNQWNAVQKSCNQC